MPTFSTNPPILIWQPGGGTPPGSTVVPKPPITNAAVTQLVNGQSYIAITFDTEQVDNTWVFVDCSVLNTTDPDPLNIWPGIITVKTSTGFTVQLNGLPDSNNYFLVWAISGVNIPPPQPFPATTYTLIGPTTGNISTASTNFTVRLPAGGTVIVPVIVTPSDSGGGGTFTPASVTLTTVSPLATFTYTPASYGAKTISTANNGGLTDPASLTFTPLAATYTFSGPSSGVAGVASTAFTVALPVGAPVTGTVTVTPSSGGGGGTFAPTSVGLTTAAPSATFIYTPVSSGAKTLSVTNNGGLTNPGNLTYTVAAAFSPADIAGLKLWLKADSLALADGTAVATWPDSSGNGNDAAQGTPGARPLFKTNKINGLPALLFDGTDDSMGLNMPGSISTAVSVFLVHRSQWTGGLPLASEISNPANSFAIYLPFTDNNIYFDLGNTTGTGRVSGPWGGNTTDFFMWSCVAGGGNMAAYRNGTTVVSSGGHTNSFNPAGLTLKINGTGSNFLHADTAEILIYDSALSSTDRANVENHLKTKYGIP